MSYKVNCIYFEKYNSCYCPQREGFLQRIYRKFFMSKEKRVQFALGTLNNSKYIVFPSNCNIYCSEICEFSIRKYQGSTYRRI